MTFRQFTINNVIRNKRLYAAYFLSSLFTVMVFFTFAVFAFHPSFMDGTVRGEIIYGMAIAGGIIYVFSFFFVLYSMNSFLQSRKKEFGLLMMQGMSTKQIRLMVFMENILIGLFATLGGILLGLVFAKAILLLAENVLVIDETLHFYVPLWAIVITFVSFMVLFLFISLFVSFILRTRKLIDLIRADIQSKGEPRASATLAIAAAVLLASGYAAALYVEGQDVILAMLPVIIVVIIGTYFFFTQWSVYLIRRLKGKKGVFWRKTNMVLFSDLSFRMKDNARTFFMVAIISTVAFSAIGSLYGFQSYLTTEVREMNPYTFTYSTYESDDALIEKHTGIVEETLNSYDIQTETASEELDYFEVENSGSREVLIAKESEYNRFAALLGEEKIGVGENEAIVVGDSSTVMIGAEQKERLMDVPIKLENGKQIHPNQLIFTSVMPEMFSYYIVADETFEALPEPVQTKTHIAWQEIQGNDEAIIEAGDVLQSQFPPGVFSAIDFSIYTINKSFGPVLFIGLFIGIVFFVSAGSFLYFRLYSDLDADKIKFKSIAKMGLTEQEMKKVINRQTAILFFAPIVVALVHGAVALSALSNLFDYNLVTESALVLGLFALIQIIYFVVVRHFYTKQIHNAIY